MESGNLYSPGDWVVHLYYGVGQINCIETKHIEGQKKKCYKVKTKHSTYWFSNTDTGNPRFRPVASEEIIKKVVYQLRRKAGRLNIDKEYWKKRIDEVKSYGDMLSISKLVRDLSAV